MVMTNLNLLFSLAFFLVLSGYWQSRSGNVCHWFAFNIHKFLALGTTAFLILIAYRQLPSVQLLGFQVAILAVAVVFILITILSGGLANLDNQASALAVGVHKIFLYFALLTAAASLYFLFFWPMGAGLAG